MLRGNQIPRSFTWDFVCRGFETEPSHKKDGTTNYKAKNVTGGSAPLKRDFGLGRKEAPEVSATPTLDLASLGLQGGALGVAGLGLAGIPGLSGLVPGLGLGATIPGLSAEQLAALTQPQMIPGLTPGLAPMAGFPMLGMGAGLAPMAGYDPAAAAAVSGELIETAPAAPAV